MNINRWSYLHTKTNKNAPITSGNQKINNFTIDFRSKEMETNVSYDKVK